MWRKRNLKWLHKACLVWSMSPGDRRYHIFTVFTVAAILKVYLKAHPFWNGFTSLTACQFFDFSKTCLKQVYSCRECCNVILLEISGNVLWTRNTHNDFQVNSPINMWVWVIMWSGVLRGGRLQYARKSLSFHWLMMASMKALPNSSLISTFRLCL